MFARDIQPPLHVASLFLHVDVFHSVGILKSQYRTNSFSVLRKHLTKREVCLHIMAAEKQTYNSSSSSLGKNGPFYINDADLSNLPPAVQKLFEEYSKIPAAQLQPHVLEVVRLLS